MPGFWPSSPFSRRSRPWSTQSVWISPEAAEAERRDDFVRAEGRASTPDPRHRRPGSQTRTVRILALLIIAALVVGFVLMAVNTHTPAR